MNELASVIEDINSMVSDWTLETPIATFREGLDSLCTKGVTSINDRHSSVEIGGIGAEWSFAPDVDVAGPAILYLHGGGYAIGSLRSHRDLCERLALSACANVLALDYRLAPEHPFPAALEDSLAAYHWLLGLGCAPAAITVAGDSAGGGLALATVLSLKAQLLPLPGSVVVLSPWTDLELSGESMQANAAVDPLVHEPMLRVWIKLYTSGIDVRNPSLSPLNGDYAGFPPLLVQVGTREVLLDDSRRLVERANAAGVEARLSLWQDEIHVFQIFGSRLTDARKAIREIGDFVQAARRKT